MLDKKVFYILGIFSFILVSVSSFLLITKNVVGFDIGGASSDSCVPYNVILERGSKDHSLKIYWSTKEKCIGFVQYGRDANNLDLVSVDLVNMNKSKEHVVTLEQLMSKEIYYFLINSQEIPYGNGGVPLQFVLDSL